MLAFRTSDPAPEARRSIVRLVASAVEWLLRWWHRSDLRRDEFRPQVGCGGREPVAVNRRQRVAFLWCVLVSKTVVVRPPNDGSRTVVGDDALHIPRSANYRLVWPIVRGRLASSEHRTTHSAIDALYDTFSFAFRGPDLCTVLPPATPIVDAPGAELGVARNERANRAVALVVSDLMTQREIVDVHDLLLDQVCVCVCVNATRVSVAEADAHSWASAPCSSTANRYWRVWAPGCPRAVRFGHASRRLLDLTIVARRCRYWEGEDACRVR